MNMRVSLLAGVACVLAACSPPAQQGADNGGDAGAGAGGNAVSTMASMEPGQYRTTVTILEMNLPGVPSSQINMQPVTSEECVTSTDIAQYASNPMNNEEGVACTQNSMNTANGHIEGESTCTSPVGTRTMHMTGTYDSTHVNMEIASTAPMPNGAGDMTQRMRMVTERIGDCPAGSAAAP